MSWRDLLKERMRLQRRSRASSQTGAAAPCKLFLDDSEFTTKRATRARKRNNDKQARMLLHIACEQLASAYVARLAEQKQAADSALNSDVDVILNNWGRALREAGDVTESLAEAEQLYELSSAKYQVALRRTPGAFWVLNNWALGMKSRAVRCHEAGANEQAEELYEEGCKLCADALAMREDSVVIMSNYGRMLREWSQIAVDTSARRRLLERSLAAFKGALRYNANDNNVLNNVGRVHRDYAQMLDAGMEREAAFARSCAMYEQALATMRDHKNTINNHAVTLMVWGSLTEEPKQREKLFADAEEKLRQLLSPLLMCAERRAREEAAAAMDVAVGVTAVASLACNGRSGDHSNAAAACAAGCAECNATAPVMAAPGAAPAETNGNGVGDAVVHDDDSGDDNTSENDENYWWAYYSLARLAAIRGQAEEARLTLLLFQQHDKLTPRMLLRENKFDSVRGLPWFCDLVATVEAACSVAGSTSGAGGAM